MNQRGLQLPLLRRLLLTANQTLINVAVETSFVQKGNEFFMVVSMYADKIQFSPTAPAAPLPAVVSPPATAPPAAAPPPIPPGKPSALRSRVRDQGLIALIQASIRNATLRGT